MKIRKQLIHTRGIFVFGKICGVVRERVLLVQKSEQAHKDNLAMANEGQDQGWRPGPGAAGNAAGGWSWSNVLSSAKDFASKAQEIAEVAGKVAQEKAVVIAAKAQEMRQNYDVDAATSSFLTAVGAIPQNADRFRPSYTDNRQSRAAIHKDRLDLVYFTENIIGMAFPCDPSKPSTADGGNDINLVSRFLKTAHEGHYMIWNISEESYDYSLFADQVLEYKFPGHPAPPLGMLFKICTSIESWLDADERNVAVIHCLTGKGRTAALIACVLTWIGEFSSPMDALQYVANRRKTTIDNLTIPSQQRYVQYFANMLDGVKPRSEPLLLRRVIINSIPIFGVHGPGQDSPGCCPYIQIFKCGRLVATTVPNGSDGKDRETKDGRAAAGLQLKWIDASEGSVSFNVDVAVQGDLLLRCRHADASGVRVSMFRAAFHTGYVPSGVLRLTRAQLDGSHSDSRYNEDFFVDLIFAPIEKAVPVSGLGESSGGEGNVAVAAGNVVAPSDSGITLDPITSDKYELTLHRDSRFWDAVANRKAKAKKRRSRKFAATAQEQFSIGDETSGQSDGSGIFGFANNLLGISDSDESPSPTPSVGGGGSAISDVDLIQQLANAEFNSFPESPPKPTTVMTTGNSATAGVGLSAVDELEALDLLEQELGLGLSAGTSSASTPNAAQSTPARNFGSPGVMASASPATATDATAGSKDKDSSAGTPKPGGSFGAPSASKGQSDDMDLDNLEDLENYLNSLSSK
jgi:hypothetical protein